MYFVATSRITGLEQNVVIALLVAIIALFNGSDLAGWTPSGEGLWTVDGGVITASGSGQGFLVSEAQYGSFGLELEFWVDHSTNSGVFIRCADTARIHPDSCYELNIWDDHPRPEARTGAIVFKAMPPLAEVHTVGRWNTLAVLAQGAVIEVRINGTLTARLEDADPAPGFLALQHWEHGTVKFRNITLKYLEN